MAAVAGSCRLQLCCETVTVLEHFRWQQWPVAIVTVIQRQSGVLMELHLVKQVVREHPVARRGRIGFEDEPGQVFEKIVAGHNLHVAVHDSIIRVIRWIQNDADVLKRVVDPGNRTGAINIIRIEINISPIGIRIVRRSQINLTTVKTAVLQGEIHETVMRPFIRIIVFRKSRPEMKSWRIDIPSIVQIEIGKSEVQGWRLIAFSARIKVRDKHCPDRQLELFLNQLDINKYIRSGRGALADNAGIS